MTTKKLFQEKIIFLNQDFEDKIALFEGICPELLKAGWIKESFQSAIIEREKHFSTGLQTEPIAVAIPHTDAEHVRKSFIALIRVNNPVIFQHMGIPEQEVNAKLIFILGISEPKNQVTILSNIINMFTNADLMQELTNETNKQVIQDKLNEEIVAKAVL